MWTTHDRFMGDSEQSWLAAPQSSYPLLNLVMKLKHMKSFFHDWNKNVFKNLTDNVLLAEDDFQAAQSMFDADASQVNSDLLYAARQTLIHTHSQEEILWRQNSRFKWLKEGDGNTKFYHAYANSRRRKSMITQLNNDDGDPVLCPTMVLNNFIAVFGSTDKWIWCPNLDGTFTSSSVRKISQGVIIAGWDKLWSPAVPLKWSILAWRLAKGCVPTDDLLAECGIPLCSMCSCCSLPSVESGTHLFYNSDVAKDAISASLLVLKDIAPAQLTYLSQWGIHVHQPSNLPPKIVRYKHFYAKDVSTHPSMVDTLPGQVDTRPSSQNNQFEELGRQVDTLKSRSTRDLSPRTGFSILGTVCRHNHQGRSTHYGNFSS
ncbi:hypothetical protein Taro_049211 [Colocasia esculenta]|uniref:Reverse transcriptase zinc-binding domain-containing protein n=1 Tax=Colocasia esculenta TaxID=4460 RepID=A0A843XAF5_COLES|nr:hypothetical protein [Colocasia esculenta]